ncbi:MAG: hypothetical protein [Wendovervirus sonii]|uniref:Virion structural protein n=1 Tax=phage Lak_Megaphage_Sonny TaxID=3109229 RepID=A0ABZ0Z650_9CAUD|nr:MAG: hypothetical protein [phage Lak_Megaphage_Sonny]
MLYINEFENIGEYQRIASELPQPQLAYFKDQGKCHAITEPGPYGVFIVDEKGKRYTVDSWDSTRTDARFVKFSNEILNPGNGQPDNSIVISKNWEYVNILPIWQVEDVLLNVKTTTDPSVAVTDYNGLLNTSSAIEDASTKKGSRTLENYIPALMYAQQTKETFKGEELHAYVPAMGQYMQIIENLEQINVALNKIHAKSFPTGSTSIWYSSTQHSYDRMWTLNNQDPGQRVKAGYFGSGAYVLPLFSI